MTYNNSEEHLHNLKIAREKASTLKKECDLCLKFFSIGGYLNHRIKCEKGKNCPICDKWFSSKSMTCSYSCSNKYFRSGKNHPNYQKDKTGETSYSYRSICFENHEKKCVVCEEVLVVAAHHLDEDKTNNDPSNLIPLCPTHHTYWHSKYKYLVEDKILKYVELWKEQNKAL